MKWKNEPADGKFNFVIEEDSDVGFYLVVYPKGSTSSIADHLQDTFEIAAEQAFEDYGADINSWVMHKHE